MNKKIIISILIASALLLVVLVAIAYAFIKPPELPTAVSPESAPPSSQRPGDTKPNESAALAKPDVITFTGERFSPAILTVRKGATIRVINESSETIEFASDSHPTHRDNSELNMDAIKPGAEGTFTVTKPGQHGYHDHLNPDNEGIVFVQE